MIDIQPPPAEYLPYDGPLEVLRLLPQQVGKLCHERGLKGWPLGCGGWIGDHCVIIVPTIDDGSIERHERAHCNGWKHQ